MDPVDERAGAFSAVEEVGLESLAHPQKQAIIITLTRIIFPDIRTPC
jgi:hypothetical protein